VNEKHERINVENYLQIQDADVTITFAGITRLEKE
jgi:hypothetical protein